MRALEAKDARAVSDALERVDRLRDDVNQGLDAIRGDMLALLRSDGEITVRTQRQVMLIAAVLTLFAAALGLVFSSIGQQWRHRSGAAICWQVRAPSRPGASMR